MKTTQKKMPKLVNPEHRAMRTKGMTHAGRITYKQYKFLVNSGHKGSDVKNWTRRRASKAIERIIEAETREADQGHAQLDRDCDNAIGGEN